MNNKIFFKTMLILPMLLVSVITHAVPVKTALGIVIDGSGSVSPSNFSIQRSAYASVLGNNTFVKADGSVVVNVIQFSTSAQIEQTAIRLNNEADRTTLVSAINAMTRLTGGTDIGEGIQLAYTNMNTFLAGLAATDFDTSFRKLIDVSTDGQHNEDIDPTDATDAAIGLGFEQVNCLGIGSRADCSWNRSGLDFSASTFADVEAALERKIGVELGSGGTVPEPAILALLALGLMGMRFNRSQKVN